MMPTELLDGFRSRGITLTVAAGRLRVGPASALTREDHQQLAHHKRDLAALLAAEPEPVWTVIGSTDPAAIGGEWIGNRWCPPPGERA